MQHTTGDILVSEQPIIHIAAATEYTLPQVRTDPVEMDAQTFEQHWGLDDKVSKDYPSSTYTFSQKYNQYQDGEESTARRDLGFGVKHGTESEYVASLNTSNAKSICTPTGNGVTPNYCTAAALHEHYVDNEYTTAWGMNNTATKFTSDKGKLLRFNTQCDAPAYLNC